MKRLLILLMGFLLFIGFGCTSQSPLPEKDTSNASFDQKVHECISATGVNGLLFIYSPSCPHCHKMQPIVDDLINANLEFTKLSSVEDRDKIAEVGKCVQLEPYVPQFVCSTTGVIKVGEMSESQLREFYNNCFNQTSQ